MRSYLQAISLIWGLALATSSMGWALSFDSDVPAKLKEQIQQDLGFMNGLKMSDGSSLHTKIFGKAGGASYQKFFESHVLSIGLNDCGSAKAVACVIPFMDNTKMWLTQNYTQFDHPQVARLMIIYHEARHTERKSSYWGHATCPEPFKDADGSDMKSIWTGATLAGEPACDVTPLGSYGSSLILLKNVSKFCTSCTDKVKMDAGMYADDQFKRIIDPSARTEIQKDLY